MYRDRCNERNVHCMLNDLESCKVLKSLPERGLPVTFASIIHSFVGFFGGEESVRISLFARIACSKFSNSFSTHRLCLLQIEQILFVQRLFK